MKNNISRNPQFGGIEGKTLIIVVLMVVTAAAIGVLFGTYVLNGNSKTDKGNKTEGEHKIIAKTDLSLGGVDVGIELKDLQKILGETKSIERLDGYEIHRYDNLKVEIRNDKVYALMTDSFAPETLRGIHVGNTYGEVISKYGSKSNETQEKFTVYEYSFDSLTGEKGVLKFYVNGPHISDRVVQISARIEIVSAISQNVEQAKLALYKFVTAINRKDYDKIYDEMLTSNYKSTVSKKEFKLRGSQLAELNFEETFNVISSKENSVVLEYSAGTRTKNQNQTIYTPWKGEIEMVFESGFWKINIVTATPGVGTPEK